MTTLTTQRSLSSPLEMPLPPMSTVEEFALMPAVIRTFKMTTAAVIVWLWGYLGLSIAWMYVGLGFYVAANECRKIKEAKKKYAHQAIHNERSAVLSRVDEHPSWVSISAFQWTFHTRAWGS